MPESPEDRRTNPPKDLDSHHRHVYKALRREMRALGTWRDQDMHALASCVRCLQTVNHATAELEAYRAEHGKLTVAGSKGQEVAHPLVRVIREAQADYASWLGRLLLTPEARAKADVRPKDEGGKLGL